jgi:hypothetical protein
MCPEMSITSHSVLPASLVTWRRDRTYSGACEGRRVSVGLIAVATTRHREVGPTSPTLEDWPGGKNSRDIGDRIRVAR